MSAIVTRLESVKRVVKPWGWERWITDSSFPYVLKQIYIRAPHKSSLQLHLEKHETAWITEGSGYLHLCGTDIDVEKYSAGLYSNERISELLEENSYRRLLKPGEVFHIPPGTIHRVEALEDIMLIEASTTELDDVIRLRDDAGRKHGRIDAEHV